MKNINTLKANKGLTHISKRIGYPDVWNLAAILLLMLILASCSKDEVDPVNEKEPEITDEVKVELPTDPGEVGLVVNAREIFRKGYTATKAEVTFADYPEFNETLEINPVTNVAILRIPNEDLAEEQKNAFASGVAVDIIVYDESQMMLTEYHDDKQVLDDTNTPLTIHSELEYNIPPVALKEGVPYYVQPEEVGGDGDFAEGVVLSAITSRLYTFAIPDPDNISYTFKYYFKPASDSTYYILREDPAVGPRWYFRLDVESPTLIELTEDESIALEFVFEQAADGWVQIREKGTGRYVTIIEGSSSEEDTRKALRLIANTDDHFRFISASIEWSAVDRGTEFSQSIIPPSEIDFAYAATIKNCSEGMLTEEVGLIKERTSTRSMQTTESLQFFAGAQATVGMTTGVSAGASVPGVGDVSASVEVSAELSLTTNVTTSNENTVGSETSVTSAVSRIRTLEIPPFTGVEVFDAVRVVKKARVPFTQVIRLTANYKNGISLTGDEIKTQMLFNFVTAVPIDIGEDYVDVGLTGFVTINEMFETETGVHEISDACD